MLTEHEQELISAAIRETIRQLKADGLLRSVADREYKAAGEALRQYYRDGEKKEDIRDALEELKRDKYFKILPLYYSYGYTIEEIAETFDVEFSTISRNKKRLSLEVYNRIRH